MVNHLAQYDQVADRVVSYSRWIARLHASTRARRFAEYRIPSTTLWTHLRIPTLRNPRRRVKLFERFATAQDRSSEYFAVAVDPYPLHALADLVYATQPDADYRRLLRVHASYIKQLRRHNVAPIVGVIVAAGLFLLSKVPEVIAADILGSVAAFQRLVFWTTAGVVGVVLFYVTTTWLDYAVRRRRFALVEDVLEYIVICTSDALVEEPNQGRYQMNREDGSQ